MPQRSCIICKIVLARYDLAKMFLHCLNHWKLETPTARKQQMSSEDVSAYKVCNCTK